MKKIFLISAALTLVVSFKGWAQDKYVVSANVSFNRGDMDEAKDDIDKAMSSPETMEKPKALWTRAQIYKSLAGIDKYKAVNPNYEAVLALEKLSELKPDYEKKAVDQDIAHFISLYYNDGVKVYNGTDTANKYRLVADTMRLVVKLCDLNGGKRFEGNTRIDTIRANAYRLEANCMYYMGKYEEAIPMLVQVKNSPISKSVGAYENLIDAYDKTRHTAEEGAAIQEARAAYPDNDRLRNAELNYYVVTGKADVLITKLEEAVAKDPNNADLQVSLANAYNGLASPATGKKPANSADYAAKAEAAYIKSVTLKPESPELNYLTGAFYYNEAKEVNDDMNNITGSSDADLKKYDALKVKRDGLFEKSLPYMEKCFNILDPKATAGTLKDTERQILFAVKQSLYNTYLILNKMDKANAVKAKMGK